MLGIAISYVWPTSVVLQLRVVACVIIILAMRVLNLAVPILYKSVVDKLADVSSRTHPNHGEAPEHFTFKEVSSTCHRLAASMRHCISQQIYVALWV